MRVGELGQSGPTRCDFHAELRALLAKHGCPAGDGAADALRSVQDKLGTDGWTCLVCKSHLAGRCFSEEVYGDSHGELFCDTCFAVPVAAPPVPPVLTVHYAAAKTRARALATSVALGPAEDAETEARAVLREELKATCEKYLRIVKKARGTNNFSGERFGIFVSHVPGERAKDRHSGLFPDKANSGRKKQKSTARSRLQNVHSSLGKLDEVYDDISRLVHEILAKEQSALTELMTRLRPGALAGNRLVRTRALELILAEPGAPDQNIHKDMILAGQAQAQLYVTGAPRATQVMRFDGNPIETQRDAYVALHGEEPGRGWEGKANILAELASVFDADKADLRQAPISRGAVPPGQWQCIGEVGAVHFGPGTKELRIILVTVLTVGDDYSWSPLQVHGPNALCHLGNALGLLRLPTVNACACEYLRKRTVKDEEEWIEYIRSGAIVKPELPSYPDFYMSLLDLLASQARDYTAHTWDPMLATAYVRFVLSHSKGYCEDAAFDVSIVVDGAKGQDRGLLGRFPQPPFPADEIALWDVWRPVAPVAEVSTEAQDGGSESEEDDDDDQVDSSTCGDGSGSDDDGSASDGAVSSAGVASATGTYNVSQHRPQPAGVYTTTGRRAGMLAYDWDSKARLVPGVHCEAFHVVCGSMVFVDDHGRRHVFKTGEFGYLLDGCKGTIEWDGDLVKRYTSLDWCGNPVIDDLACDGCGRLIGHEYYRYRHDRGENFCAALETWKHRPLLQLCNQLELQPPCLPAFALVPTGDYAKLQGAAQERAANEIRAAWKKALGAKPMPDSLWHKLCDHVLGSPATATSGQAKKKGLLVMLNKHKIPPSVWVQLPADKLEAWCRESGIEPRREKRTRDVLLEMLRDHLRHDSSAVRYQQMELCAGCYLKRRPADVTRHRCALDVARAANSPAVLA